MAGQAISVQEAARLAGVSRETIYAWVERQVIRPIPTPDPRLMLDRAEVEKVARQVASGQPLATKPKHIERKLARRKRVLDLCRKYRFITIAEIARRQKCTAATVYLDVSELREDGSLSGSPESGWVVSDTDTGMPEPVGVPAAAPAGQELWTSPVHTVSKSTKRKLARRARILDLVHKHPHITIAELARRQKCTASTVYMDIAELRDDGSLSGSPGSGWVATSTGQ